MDDEIDRIAGATRVGGAAQRPVGFDARTPATPGMIRSSGHGHAVLSEPPPPSDPKPA